jgi:hypothetical protein
MIEWKKKLTSRKFWAGVAGFIAPILVLLRFPESEVVTVTSLITASGTLIAYIFSEGWVDAVTKDECGKEDGQNE